MKNINIFFASSEELKLERGEFSDIIDDLNHALKPLDLMIDPFKWEHLDSSMGQLHKQEEYNIKIRQCNICLVMFWERFGEYTEQELNTAYEAKRNGNNMHEIWLFCKEPAVEELGLKDLKGRYFKDYGQQYIVIDNIERMRYEVIRHVVQYLENQKLIVGPILKEVGSKIFVNGMRIRLA